MNNKLLYGIASGITTGIVAGIVLLLAFQLGLFQGSTKLAGTTNYDQLDTKDGYSVDGTSFVDGTGILTGAINTANSVTLTGTVTMSGGDNRIANILNTGTKLSITTTLATTTITAAQVCDNSKIFTTVTGTAYSVLIPSSSPLAADCLTTVGDSREVWVYPGGTASASIVTANSPSTTLVRDNTYNSLIGGAWRLNFTMASSAELIVGVDTYR